MANNLIIATLKTSAADLMSQMAIERKPLSEVDWQRNFVFCVFGFAYLGGFQYWYQARWHAIECPTLPPHRACVRLPWWLPLASIDTPPPIACPPYV